MNVTAEQIRAYIDEFLRTLEETAVKLLPPEYMAELLHFSLMPARIIGYVSTQFGVAIEYENAPETSIEISTGDARIENLFVQAPEEVQATHPMISVEAPETVFINCVFSKRFPFRLSTDNASALFKGVTFETKDWKREVRFAEVFRNSNAANWTIEKAQLRAKDEVLAALVQVRSAQDKKITIADYINHFKERIVLVLGSYDIEGIKRLQAIKQALISHGYDPILLKDIPDHPHQDLTQKVVAIGAVSRFVVVDDSSKSGHLVEIQLCKQNDWVTVLLQGDGRSMMTAGASHTSNVILELPYDPSSTGEAITRAAGWAEAKLQELQRKFGNTYPWRIPG